MGYNDHMSEDDDFVAIAIEAGALGSCPLHPGVTINQGNPDAERHAYAIATNKLKTGELVGDRADIMEGIKDAIEQSAEECPECAGLRDA